MIQVRFLQQPNGVLLGFEILGHSGYGESGTDILCAAVSSAAYLTANTITEVLRAEVADVSVSDARMTLRVSEKSASSCGILLNGLKLHLLGLEEQYPDNMKVSYTEV